MMKAGESTLQRPPRYDMICWFQMGLVGVDAIFPAFGRNCYDCCREKDFAHRFENRNLLTRDVPDALGVGTITVRDKRYLVEVARTALRYCSNPPVRLVGLGRSQRQVVTVRLGFIKPEWDREVMVASQVCAVVVSRNFERDENVTTP